MRESTILNIGQSLTKAAMTNIFVINNYPKILPYSENFLNTTASLTRNLVNSKLKIPRALKNCGRNTIFCNQDLLPMYS